MLALTPIGLITSPSLTVGRPAFRKQAYLCCNQGQESETEQKEAALLLPLPSRPPKKLSISPARRLLADRASFAAKRVVQTNQLLGVGACSTGACRPADQAAAELSNASWPMTLFSPSTRLNLRWLYYSAEVNAAIGAMSVLSTFERSLAQLDAKLERLGGVRAAVVAAAVAALAPPSAWRQEQWRTDRLRARAAQHETPTANG